MKPLVIILFALATAGSAIAATAPEQITEVLSTETYESTLDVKKNTYIWNIQGYACPVPGLLIDRVDLDTKLNHDLGFRVGSDLRHLSVGIKDPNFEFCSGLTTVEEAFGPELVPGAKLPMRIQKVLDLRLREYETTDGKVEKVTYLKETITINVNGRTLETAAQIVLKREDK